MGYIILASSLALWKRRNGVIMLGRKTWAEVWYTRYRINAPISPLKIFTNMLSSLCVFQGLPRELVSFYLNGIYFAGGRGHQEAETNGCHAAEPRREKEHRSSEDGFAKVGPDAETSYAIGM